MSCRKGRPATDRPSAQLALASDGKAGTQRPWIQPTAKGDDFRTTRSTVQREPPPRLRSLAAGRLLLFFFFLLLGLKLSLECDDRNP